MMAPRILLVDDDVALTRTLALYLREVGNCDVRVENVGRLAVAAAREFRPNLVVLDIVMPDADGGSVAPAAIVSAPKAATKRAPSRTPAVKRPTKPADRPPEICPTCFMAIPRSGVCDNCG